MYIFQVLKKEEWEGKEVYLEVGFIQGIDWSITKDPLKARRITSTQQTGVMFKEIVEAFPQFYIRARKLKKTVSWTLSEEWSSDVKNFHKLSIKT